MVELKELLARFSRLISSKEAHTENLRKIVFEVSGVELKKEEVKIKGKTIYLNTRPIYKNQIFLKQEEILSKLKEKTGENSPEEFR